MSDPSNTLIARATPEEAAAAVRRGRPGYLLCTKGPTGLWAAFGEHVHATKTEAVMYGRAAIAQAGDASRVVVLDEHGERLRVPVPQEIRRTMRKAGAR